MIKEINYIDTLPIRQAVLWPNKSINELILPGDENAKHLGYFLNDKLVGVISIFMDNNEAQFRKFAVLKEFQGRGIGSELLKEVFRTKYVNSIWCNARVTATELYEKFGMEIVPNFNFKRGNIKYVIMKRRT